MNEININSYHLQAPNVQKDDDGPYHGLIQPHGEDGHNDHIPSLNQSKQQEADDDTQTGGGMSDIRQYETLMTLSTKNKHEVSSSNNMLSQHDQQLLHHDLLAQHYQ